MFFSFLISLLASISTFFGGLVIFFKEVDKKKIISISMYFASGVMIAVGILDLSPTGIFLLSNYYGYIKALFLFLFLLIIGIIISKIINRASSKNNKNSLYNAGIFSFITIILHNIPEGIATFITSSNDIKLGISFATAIALHNIPEGITIAIPIYYSTGKKKNAFLYTFLAGISEFFGAIIAFVFFAQVNINIFLGILYPIIVGIMLFLSIEELIPNAKIYDVRSKYKVFLIIGIVFMFIIHLIT